MTTPKPIRPWRLAAGVLFHLAAPFYLLTLAVLLLPIVAAGGSHERLAAAAARASVDFLLCFIVVVIVLTLLVRAAEPLFEIRRTRPQARSSGDSRDASRARLEQSLRRVRSWRSAPLSLAAEVRLSQADWHHHDTRVQAITSDLERVTMTFDSRLSESGSGDLDRLAADVLDRLTSAAAVIGDEHRRLEDGDARTLARYIELRYPSSDLTGA